MRNWRSPHTAFKKRQEFTRAGERPIGLASPATSIHRFGGRNGLPTVIRAPLKGGPHNKYGDAARQVVIAALEEHLAL